MKIFFTAHLIFLSVLFLAACSQQPTQTSETLTPTQTQTTVTQQTSTQIQNNQSNWATYKNDEYKFEFKYPKDWEIDSSRTDADSIVFSKVNSPPGESREAINFQKNTGNVSLEDAVKEFATKREYKNQQINYDYPIKIGGQKTVKIDTNEFGTTIYMFMKNQTIFTIEKQMLFSDDVLKTFTFTE